MFAVSLFQVYENILRIKASRYLTMNTDKKLHKFSQTLSYHFTKLSYWSREEKGNQRICLCFFFLLHWEIVILYVRLVKKASPSCLSHRSDFSKTGNCRKVNLIWYHEKYICKNAYISYQLVTSFIQKLKIPRLNYKFRT